ncbi:MAG TPA: rRNA maturation RNase YbeY [Candidatus Paceibacterota bacterium]|nr:rRNA maturation RNase YbeY [Candidatus Paceibacterota bacterium]
MTIISFAGRGSKIPLTSQELQFIVDTAQKLLGDKLPKNLPLVLNCKVVSEKKIIAINETWRHKKQPSPIIAFPDYYLKVKDEPVEEEVHLGDMFICLDVLTQRTRENFAVFNQQNFRQQFIRSFIHSLLHLYGYTHEEDKKAELMERKEQQVADIVIKKLIKK